MSDRMPHADRYRILLVDDDEQLLAGLALQLRRRYRVETSTSAADALRKVNRNDPYAVVVSDMRMPGADGSTLLASMHQILPDTTRILLTGYANLESAVSAVNRGGIFRFLVKPCAPAEFLGAVQAGVELFRLRTGEKELLERTLSGSVNVLVQLMALASPLVFGRATRIKQRVSALAQQLGVEVGWELEMATLLSHSGYVSLQPAVAQQLYYGIASDPAVRDEICRVERLGTDMLRQVPRLEPVCAIIDGWRDASAIAMLGPSTEYAALASRLLRVAIEFDEMEMSGMDGGEALATLRGRAGRHDIALDALQRVVGDAADAAPTLLEIPLSASREGMRLAEDVTLPGGTLFIPRGYEITASTVARIDGLSNSVASQRVRVFAPRTAPH